MLSSIFGEKWYSYAGTLTGVYALNLKGLFRDEFAQKKKKK